MSDQYRGVAFACADGGIRYAIKIDGWLKGREQNLLFVLGEHVGRFLSVDDVCHRLKISHTAIKITCCSLRSKLHHDWTIQGLHREVRLCYIGGPLADADRTWVEILPSAATRYV